MTEDKSSERPYPTFTGISRHTSLNTPFRHVSDLSALATEAAIARTCTCPSSAALALLVSSSVRITSEGTLVRSPLRLTSLKCTIPSPCLPVCLWHNLYISTLVFLCFVDRKTHNDYIETSIQKGDIPGFSGCVVHTSVISQLIREAKEQKGDITCVLLDLANAYESVPHELIKTAMSHYHIPARVVNIINSYFRDSSCGSPLKTSQQRGNTWAWT